jgi:hypothetical protein
VLPGGEDESQENGKDLFNLSGVNTEPSGAVAEQFARAIEGWIDHNDKAVGGDEDSAEISLVSILGGGFSERPPTDAPWEKGRKFIESGTLDIDRSAAYTKVGSDCVYDNTHAGIQINAANLDKNALANTQAGLAKGLVSVLRKRAKRGKKKQNTYGEGKEELFQGTTKQYAEFMVSGGLCVEETDGVFPKARSEIDSEFELQTTPASSKSNSETPKGKLESCAGCICAENASCGSGCSSTRQSFWEEDRHAEDSIVLSEIHDEEQTPYKDIEFLCFSGIHHTAEELQVKGFGELNSTSSTIEEPKDDGQSNQSCIRESCDHAVESRKEDQENEKNHVSDTSIAQSNVKDEEHCLRYECHHNLKTERYAPGVLPVRQAEDGHRACSPLFGELKEANRSRATRERAPERLDFRHSPKAKVRRIRQRITPQRPQNMKEEVKYLESLGFKLIFDQKSSHSTTLEFTRQESDDSLRCVYRQSGEFPLSEAILRSHASRKEPLELRHQFSISNLCLPTISANGAFSSQPWSHLAAGAATKKLTSGDGKSGEVKKLPNSSSTARVRSLLITKDSLSLLHDSIGAVTSQNRPGTSTTKQQSSDATSRIRTSSNTTGTGILHRGPLSRLEYALQLQYAKLTSTLAETKIIATKNPKTLNAEMPFETIKQAPARTPHTSKSQRVMPACKSATSRSELTSNKKRSNDFATTNPSLSLATRLEYSSYKADASLGRRNIKKSNSINHLVETLSTPTTQRSRASKNPHTSFERYSNTVASSHGTSHLSHDAEHTLPATEVPALQVHSRASLKLLNDKFQSRLNAETLKSQSLQNMDNEHLSSSRAILQDDIEPLSISRRKHRSSSKQDVPTSDSAQLKNATQKTPQSRSKERTLTNDEVRNGVPDDGNAYGLRTPESMSGTLSARKSSGGRHNTLVTPESRRSLSVAATLGYGSGTTNTMSESPKSRQTPQHLQSPRDTMDIDRKSISPSTSDFQPSLPRPIEGEYEKRKRIESSRYVNFTSLSFLRSSQCSQKEQTSYKH